MLHRIFLASACMLGIAACEPGIEPTTDIFRAGAYTVSAPELTLHAAHDGEPLGRVFRGEAIELQHIADDGWALAHVPSAAIPCVWLRFLDEPDPAVLIFNFSEDEPFAPVSGEACQLDPATAPEDDRAAYAAQFSDDDPSGTPTYTTCERAEYWKNWDWEEGAGLGPADGTLERGTDLWWRYVTSDRNGVMARTADDNWVFVAAACVPLQVPTAQ